MNEYLNSALVFFGDILDFLLALFDNPWIFVCSMLIVVGYVVALIRRLTT